MRVDKGSLSIVLLLCLAGTAFSASIKVDDRQTIYLAEMEAQAAAAFDRLDRDRDKTLDYGEVRGHLGKKAFIAADPDKDTTLTKEEYVEMAEKTLQSRRHRQRRRARCAGVKKSCRPGPPKTLTIDGARLSQILAARRHWRPCRFGEKLPSTLGKPSIAPSHSSR